MKPKAKSTKRTAKSQKKNQKPKAKKKRATPEAKSQVLKKPEQSQKPKAKNKKNTSKTRSQKPKAKWALEWEILAPKCMQNTGFNSKKQQIAGEAASDWKTKKIQKKQKKSLKKCPPKCVKENLLSCGRMSIDNFDLQLYHSAIRSTIFYNFINCRVFVPNWSLWLGMSFLGDACWRRCWWRFCGDGTLQPGCHEILSQPPCKLGRSHCSSISQPIPSLYALQLYMHEALPPPLPPMGWVPYTGPIWDLPPPPPMVWWGCGTVPLPPPWCGGGVVWYVGYVWCVWSVWYGMFGKYGMFGRYGMYGMNGWCCMDSRYGMFDMTVCMVCMVCMVTMMGMACFLCKVGMVCMACMFAIVCMVGDYVSYVWYVWYIW